MKELVGPMAARVGEWVARKETHASDPFADDALWHHRGFESGVSGATAVVGTTIVASSSRVQRANGRVYFPVQDCLRSAFTLSDKRWR